MSAAPFILILRYIIGGMPSGQNAELFHFEVDQVSLSACEQSLAKIQHDFPGMVGGCKMKIPELYDPTGPADCYYPSQNTGYIYVGNPCWIIPATVPWKP